MCGRFSVLLTSTLVFGCLVVVGVMQETSGGKLSRIQYIKLRKSFIEKAKEQHLKLLQKDVDRRKGLRQRRSTDTAQYSYDSAKSSRPIEFGLKLNVTFSEMNETWKVNINWNKPSRGGSFPDNQINCTGYEISWLSCLSLYRSCGHSFKIEDENVTSYTFNDSNGLKSKISDPPLVIVAAYSLPKKPEAEYKLRSLYGCKNDKITVDPVNGYDPSSSFIKLNVTFIKVGEESWNAIVNWNKPVQENQRRCTGYEILWYELEGITHCDVISDENVTSYTIKNGQDSWQPNEFEPEQLLVAVHPLPKRTNRIDYGGKFWQFNIKKNDVPAQPTTVTEKEITKTTLTTEKKITKTNFTANGTRTTVTTEKPRRTFANSQKVEDTSESVALYSCLLVAGALILIVILGICWVYHRRRIRGHNLHVEKMVKERNSGNSSKKAAHYISYYPDNDNVTDEVVKIANWLKQQNIDIIFDKFEVATQGKRIWSERNLSAAKKVILVVSPGYLRLCKFDENGEKEKKVVSNQDQQTYNEVCHIRDEITKKPIDTDRFVVVLIQTFPGDLPCWMKKLNTYEYSNGVLEESIVTGLAA